MGLVRALQLGAAVVGQHREEGMADMGWFVGVVDIGSSDWRWVVEERSPRIVRQPIWRSYMRQIDILMPIRIIVSPVWLWCGHP